jgi:hypothetical protein
MSWTFEHNIVYNIFQEVNHSAFKTDWTRVIVSFNNNVYDNPYGTPLLLLLFGIAQPSFSQWQQTEHDNNSVIADPLFAGDMLINVTSLQFNPSVLQQN